LQTVREVHLAFGHSRQGEADRPWELLACGLPNLPASSLYQLPAWIPIVADLFRRVIQYRAIPADTDNLDPEFALRPHSHHKASGQRSLDIQDRAPCKGASFCLPVKACLDVMLVLVVVTRTTDLEVVLEARAVVLLALPAQVLSHPP